MLRWFLTFLLLVMDKRKDTVLLAVLKTLTYFKNPSSNPLQRACCGIQKKFYKPLAHVGKVLI
jgi:hypothetical protein